MAEKVEVCILGEILDCVLFSVPGASKPCEMSMWTQTRHADSTIQTRCQKSSQTIPPASKSQTRAVSWFVNCISGEHLYRNQFVFLVRNKYTNIFCSSDMWGNYIFMFWNIREVVKHRAGEWHKSFRLQASCQRKSTNMNRANVILNVWKPSTRQSGRTLPTRISKHSHSFTHPDI